MNDLLTDITADLEQGKNELALGKCRALLKQRPDDGTIHSELARILVRLGRYEEATAASQTAIALNSELALPHAVLGYTQLRKQQFQEAEQNLLTALELDSQDSLSHYYLGLVYYSRGKVADAALQFEEAIALNPQEGQFHARLAIAYLRLNRLKASLSELAAALKLDWRAREIYFALALLPLASLAQCHPVIRILALLLLCVPLLAPKPVSTVYWIVVGVYWGWLAVITFKRAEALVKVSLLAFGGWWILAPWFLELVERLVAFLLSP